VTRATSLKATRSSPPSDSARRCSAVLGGRVPKTFDYQNKDAIKYVVVQKISANQAIVKQPPRSMINIYIL
jgi:hypothetical protein